MTRSEVSQAGYEKMIFKKLSRFTGTIVYDLRTHPRTNWDHNNAFPRRYILIVKRMWGQFVGPFKLPRGWYQGEDYMAATNSNSKGPTNSR